MQELQRRAIKCGYDSEFAAIKYASLIKESLDLNVVDPTGTFPMYIYGPLGDPVANTEIRTLDGTFWYIVTQSIYQNNMLFKIQKRIVLYNLIYSFNTIRGLLMHHQDSFHRMHGRHFNNRSEVFW